MRRANHSRGTDACRLVCLVVSQNNWRYVNSRFSTVMYPHPVAAGINADIEEAPYRRIGRWFILAALAYYLTQTYALTTLTGDYAVPGYPADVSSGVVLTAYYVFA